MVTSQHTRRGETASLLDSDKVSWGVSNAALGGQYASQYAKVDDTSIDTSEMQSLGIIDRSDIRLSSCTGADGISFHDTEMVGL